MSTVIILLIILFLATLITNRKRIVQFIKYRRKIANLPQINLPAYPLIGHAYRFVGDPTFFFHFVTDMAQSYIEKTKEKLAVVWLGPLPVVIVLHPEAKEVILKSSKHMEKSYFYTFLHPWLGTGLLTSKGEKWKQRRRLITPSFHFNILQDFVEVMNEQSQVLVTKIWQVYKEGKKLDVNRAVTLCTLDIICETAMGKMVNAQTNRDSAYVKALYRISDIIQLRQKTPLFWWDYGFEKLKLGKEHAQLLKILHGFTNGVIREKMENQDIKKTSCGRMAFLDVLLNTVTEDGEKLSLPDIQEEVDTFMFEGHDTTAAAMTWTIYLIGRHPEVQRRVHEELDEVFEQDLDRSATMEDLKKLQYLELVIKESLRLFPSVPFMGRVTTEDCDIDGYLVPKGTQIATFVYNLHHNEEVWEDPELFNPERFTKENSTGRHPFSYIPFSAGPRNCIGQRFALLEEKVIVSQLLRRFSVTSHDKREDIKMVGDLVLRPASPLNITLAERVPFH